MPGLIFFGFRLATEFLVKKLEVTNPHTDREGIDAAILDEMKVILKDELLLAFTTPETQGYSRSLEHVKWAVAVRLWNKLVPGAPSAAPCIYQGQEPLEKMSASYAGLGLDCSMIFQIVQQGTLAQALDLIEPVHSGVQLHQLPARQATQPLDPVSPITIRESTPQISPPVTPERRQPLSARPVAAAVPRTPTAVRQLASPPSTVSRRARRREELRHRGRHHARHRVTKAVHRLEPKSSLRLPFSCKLDLTGLKVHRCLPEAGCKSCHTTLSKFSRQSRIQEVYSARQYDDEESEDESSTSLPKECPWIQYSGGQIPSYQGHSVGEIPWPLNAAGPRLYCKEALWQEVIKTLGFDFMVKQDPSHPHTAPTSILLVETKEAGYTRADKWCAMAFIQRLAAEIIERPGAVAHWDVAEDVLYDRLFMSWETIKEEVVGAIQAYNGDRAEGSMVEFDSD